MLDFVGYQVHPRYKKKKKNISNNANDKTITTPGITTISYPVRYVALDLSTLIS